MKNVLFVPLLALMSSACLSNGRTVVQTVPSTHGYDLTYENAEFPPYDEVIWRVQRTGRVAKAAATALAHAPTAPETAGLLAEANRMDDALRVLEQLVDRHPDRIAPAFELLAAHLNRFVDDLHPERRGQLLKAGLAARRQASTLPREDAARAMSQLYFLDFFFTGKGREDRARQLHQFVEEYRGTKAALIAEVDLISQDTDILREIANLKKFAADHPGTTAAAKALYRAGFQLGVNVAVTGRVPRGGDPTDRLLEVFELTKELQSGRYPSSEWVERAPSLVLGLFASNPAYETANIDKVLRVYQALIDQHLMSADHLDVEFAVRALVKMARLFTLKGDSTGLEDLFAAMRRNPGQSSAIRYLEAMLYIEMMNDEWRSDRPALLGKAKAALAGVQADSDRTYHRRALATLASVHFAERDFTSARDAYRAYLRAYPQSPWSWLAALRLGESFEGLGDPRAAVAAYREAASTYRGNAVARTFGHAYAARTLEFLNRFDEALVEDQHALAAWDGAFGTAYYVSMGYPGMPSELRQDDLRREKVALRVAQLQESLRTPDGHLLERGRWLLDHGNPTEALAPLEQVLRTSSGSLRLEARLLSDRARIRRALDRGAATPRSDMTAALMELDLVARDDEYGIGVLAAKVAKASILWGQEVAGTTAGAAAPSQAKTLMHEALSEWRLHQAPSGNALPASIVRDVADIRRLVFEPSGGGVYRGWARNQIGRRHAARPFLIVNPDVPVKFSDGAEARVSIYEDPGATEQVLFLTPPQLSLLREIPVTLESDTGRQRSRIMELWNQFFPVENGMSGGFNFVSYSILAEVEYLDPERTHAAARVVVGSQGCTVLLEKSQGIWTITGLTNIWIA